jgi:hypothetical protein
VRGCGRNKTFIIRWLEVEEMPFHFGATGLSDQAVEVVAPKPNICTSTMLGF